MNNVWHWQQYFTFWTALVIGIINLLLAGAKNEINPLVQAILIGVGQYILYSGGWYGQ